MGGKKNLYAVHCLAETTGLYWITRPKATFICATLPSVDAKLYTCLHFLCNCFLCNKSLNKRNRHDLLSAEKQKCVQPKYNSLYLLHFFKYLFSCDRPDQQCEGRVNCVNSNYLLAVGLFVPCLFL